MSAPSGAELHALARARELALRARGMVSPNPLVGAVVLARDGRVVGEGYHEGPGLPHAEPMALAEAGDAARGATVVCTLEPCSHTGRTPPCSTALIDAGVARVVIGCLDPLERDRDRGIDVLRAAGIDVAVADGDDELACRALNAPFFSAALRDRPHTTLKLAAGLDGRVATVTGETRWISGVESRRLVHRWRADHDAVMVGIGTAIADDPMLNAREVDGPVRQPARVVVDSRARLPLDGALVRSADEFPLYVAVAQDCASDRVEALQGAGARVIAAGTGQVDLPAAMRILADEGVQSVFCEGGPVLAAALVRAALVDEVRWFVAPVMMGGADAPSALGGEGWARLADAPRLRGVAVSQVGDDALVTGRLTDVPSMEG